MRPTAPDGTLVPGAATPAPGKRSSEHALLQCAELSRSFGETRALRSCSVEFHPGEVHAIIGENGSGKSTLVKILSGVLAPDDGALVLDGARMERISSPRTARDLGIATVFQEILVVPSQTVLENVWLGVDGTFRRHVTREAKRAEAIELLRALTGDGLDLDAPVEALELSERQVCAIARSLVRRPRLLILDESTSALDVSTRDRLFHVVRERCAQGTAVVFISHRMDEIESVADRVTVLRSGQSVGTHARAGVTNAQLLRLMSGDESPSKSFDQRSRRTVQHRVVLRLDNVVLSPDAGLLHTQVRAGEIVGVAGLEGHGQERFVRVLAGVDRPVGGTVVRVLPEREEPIRSQRDAARLKVVYVPRDRKTEGIFEPLSIADNFSLPTADRDAVGGVLRERRRRRRLKRYIEQLRIRLASQRDAITTLSGGNQQKVLISRWLAMGPEVVVLNDPTRGVDLSTKHDIYRLLEQLAADGAAIVVLSTEVEEHLALMDRVLIFREGDVFAEIAHEELSRDRLVAAFFGEHDATATGVRDA